jgi:DNA-binding transcriptional LysR family regulator
MIDVAAVVHFPDVLRSFRTEHADVDLTLSVAPSAALLDDLQSGDLDLVVCAAPPDQRTGIDVVELLDEPLVVIAPGASDIGPPASWGPWLLFPSGSHTRQQVEEQLLERGAPIRVAAESHQPDVLLQMVALGLGWTVLPVEQVAPGDDITIGPELVRRRIVAATRTGSVRDPAVDALADLLRSA